jgi:16S rRNA processing protein RimM
MEYRQAGKITGTHGLDGRVLVRHDLGSKTAFRKLKHIFVGLKRESYIPYFIEDVKIHNDEEVLLKLDEVDSVEAARLLAGKNIYLESELYAQMKPRAVSVDMKGFTVIDAEKGVLGTIADLFETPGQVLATVWYQGKEVIIPLVDATVVGIDGSRKTIQVRLPEGLLDVYL